MPLRMVYLTPLIEFNYHNMKQIIIIFLFFIGSKLFAQEENPLSLIVEYRMTHRIDSTQPDNPYIENFLLLVNKNYSWYDRFALGTKKVGMTHIEGATPGGVPYNSFTEYNKNTIVKNFKGRKMFTELFISQVSYSIEENVPVLSWILQSDTKTIADFPCQKALASFKGRNYIAWFTNKLPYPTGPWKFGGLPGLILEVYDEKKEVQFNFVSFYTPTPDLISLTENKKSVKISPERYKKMQVALNENPGAMSGITGVRSGNIVAVNTLVGVAPPPQIKPRKANNPIEKE